MELFTRSHRKHFAGRVIDGPFEGDWIECDDSYFVGQVTQPVYALYTGWPTGAEVNRVIYKWLPSYRAWAWLQPS